MRTLLAFILRRDPLAEALERAVEEARRLDARAAQAERAVDALEAERDHWRGRALAAEERIAADALLRAQWRGGMRVRA